MVHLSFLVSFIFYSRKLYQLRILNLNIHTPLKNTTILILSYKFEFVSRIEVQNDKIFYQLYPSTRYLILNLQNRMLNSGKTLARWVDWQSEDSFLYTDSLVPEWKSNWLLSLVRMLWAFVHFKVIEQIPSELQIKKFHN